MSGTPRGPATGLNGKIGTAGTRDGPEAGVNLRPRRGL